jgi:hypothetical protein
LPQYVDGQLEHALYEGVPVQVPLWVAAVHPGQLQAPLVARQFEQDVAVAVPEHVPALPSPASPTEPELPLDPEPLLEPPDDPPELLEPGDAQVPATHASPPLHAVPLQHISPTPPQPPAAPSAPPS